jgi:hypothetical protein
MDKKTKRELKLLATHDPEARRMLKEIIMAEKKMIADQSTVPLTGPIDCACVIHGNGYTWEYVDKLYSMLSRHLGPGINLHVYTEAEREVPAPYIKHILNDWNVSGPKKSWWYKMELFNAKHHAGPLLYFDLDVVLTRNIDWIWQLSLQNFWTVRDFKYLWRKTSYHVNSSVMWWDTRLFDFVYQDFIKQDFSLIIKKYPGDQDYINDHISLTQRRFFETQRIASWRWEAHDGGYDFEKRYYKQPGTGTMISNTNSVLIFHGHPKPHQTQDPLIVEHWK